MPCTSFLVLSKIRPTLPRLTYKKKI